MGRIGSRLPAERVVAGVRARILARIQLEPGIAVLGLHAHFPVGHGALQHHLGVLAARGHVTSAKVGRFRRY